MSDFYDPLVKVAMGVAVKPEDLAAMTAAGLVVEETKLVITAPGRAALKEGDNARKMAVVVTADDVRRLVREYPGIQFAAGIRMGRKDFMGLTGARANGLVEVGNDFIVTKWGDTEGEFRRPAHTDMLVRLSAKAAEVWNGLPENAALAS